jgi:hypothetical protein
MKTPAVVLTLVASTTLLNACTSTPRSDGPIVFSTEESRVCGPLPAFSNAALGINLPDNLPEGVVIESIEPLGTTGVTVGDSFLMPAADNARLLLDSFPPTNQTPKSWQRAIPAIGSALPTGTAYDLVIEIEASKSGGGFDGVRVGYSFGGESFETTSHLGITLSTMPCE